MKNPVLLLILSTILLWGCTPSEKQQELNTIAKLESILKAEKDVNKEKDSAEELISKSIAFAAKYPQDTVSASLLFKAADVSRGLGLHNQAIQLWGRVNKEYPTHKTAPEALFLQGFTYDQGLNDATQAKKYYKFFQEKHPDHPLGKDVSLMLQQLTQDKTDLELIKEFKKKSQGELE
jgi:tetratricopeptide (TPR) repeat protein